MHRNQRYITVLLFVIVAFFVGLLAGNAWMSNQAPVSKVLQHVELSAESFLVEQELFAQFETNCEFAQQRLETLSSQLWNLGKILGAEDAESRLGEEDYAFLKKKYHLLQIRTYTLYKELSQECLQTNVVLFYFSRHDPQSEKQGQVLDELVKSYDLTVFAIERAYSSELLFLEQYYGVTKSPTLIVNFEHQYKGLAPANKLAEILNE